MKSVNGFEVLDRTFITGETPIQAFGVWGGRRDFDARDLRSLWDGCIDAPEYIPSGKVIVVGKELTIVPASVSRG